MNRKYPKINLLVTADYELFLGRNFVSDDEVLFKPTKKMLEVCESHNIPITFYADICSVWAHQKYGLTDYTGKFENQLVEANANGHDVQLHLHPHWINSTYDNGEWNISTDKMYLYEFGFDNGEDSAQAIIKQGIDYLNDLLHATNPDYNCTSFRAAGLALQPNEDKLIKALHQYGIKTDSSIAKGLIFNIDTIIPGCPIMQIGLSVKKTVLQVMQKTVFMRFQSQLLKAILFGV